MPRLVQLLDTKGGRSSVSLDKLSDYVGKYAQSGQTKMTPQVARERYTKFDPKVRYDIKKISDYLQMNGISAEQFYKEMDMDMNGTVDKSEFVSRLSYKGITGLGP